MSVVDGDESCNLSLKRAKTEEGEMGGARFLYAPSQRPSLRPTLTRLCESARASAYSNVGGLDEWEGDG